MMRRVNSAGDLMGCNYNPLLFQEKKSAVEVIAIDLSAFFVKKYEQVVCLDGQDHYDVRYDDTIYDQLKRSLPAHVHCLDRGNIQEIILLTERESDVAKETFEQTMLGDDDLHELHSTHVEVLLHHFNLKLEEAGVSHQVMEVLYSNTPDSRRASALIGASSHKAAVGEALLCAGVQPILIDNDEKEHEAWSAVVASHISVPGIIESRE